MTQLILMSLKIVYVFFDDTDVISDRRIRESVYKLLDRILEIGRHRNIFLICTNHLVSDGKTTQ
jgi:hypothetical protein